MTVAEIVARMNELRTAHHHYENAYRHRRQLTQRLLDGRGTDAELDAFLDAWEASTEYKRLDRQLKKLGVRADDDDADVPGIAVDGDEVRSFRPWMNKARFPRRPGGGFFFLAVISPSTRCPKMSS
jgi:hypothetical protein